jgi:Fe-coproporphyrin III synthase
MLYFLSSGYDILVNVTNICDARCVMCNIWKNQDTGNSFLSPELLKSVHPVSTISFAGGEPFLHEGIVEVVRVIHERNPHAKVVFSSNGFRPEAIADAVKSILAFHRNTQVTVSLDGVGRIHDRIRGIPGAWEKVNRTMDLLAETGLKQRNFAFTITAENCEALPDVYAHARNKGVGLSLAVAQSSKFLNVNIPRIEHDKVYPHLNPIIEQLLRGWNPHEWARAFFFYGILRYLDTGRRPILCDALDRQFMIDQTGAVYSCHPILLMAGTLAQKPLADILGGEQARKLKPVVRGCHACWEVCTARSSIRGQLGRVAAWTAWNKLLAHLRLRDGHRPTRLFPLTKRS